MISFRDSRFDLDTAAQLRRLGDLARTGDAETFLIEAGILEQAVTDALAPVEDTWGPIQVALRNLLGLAGRCYAETSAGTATALIQCLAELARAALPRRISGKIPEGYLHYALDPRDYAAAAADYVREAPARAQASVIIGVRSIGTSLSGVVAAVTGSSRSLTLRPRGASGSRSVATDRSLTQQLMRWAEEGRDVLVVDEGPGATGETLHCVGRWLAALGIQGSRLILFPSHTGGMALAHRERRDWFVARRKYPPHINNERRFRVTGALNLSEPQDLSGGLWRGFVPGASEAAASVNHERLKYLARDEKGDPFLIRYAGLGSWGHDAIDRARRLAELGIGPEVRGVAEGFVACRWQEGRVAVEAETRSEAFLRDLGRYLGGRWGAFPAEMPHSGKSLVPALLENSREALSENPCGLHRAARLLESMPEGPAIIPDARLHPSEWIKTSVGYRKTDAVDHGNDTRLPGPAHAAWDFAGAAVEYDLDDATVQSLVSSIPTRARERDDLLRAVAVYRTPYAACCLGEVDIAAREANNEDDRRRLAREVSRYVRLLRRELLRHA